MSSSEKSGLIIYSSNHTKPNEHIPKRILETVLGKHGKYDCTKKREQRTQNLVVSSQLPCILVSHIAILAKPLQT
jgi:hypothetical protein